MKALQALSLFSGAGGFDIGFERAGIRTVAFAENDKWASEVLAARWPDIPNLGDVTAIGNRGHGAEDERRNGSGSRLSLRSDVFASIAGSSRSIDLIHGGFPCQDLSVAGNRAGLGGERSNLWFEFQRVLSELRPRWTVIENVAGLLSSNGGRDFGIILEGLEECGFDGIGWAVLDAQNFGVPQRRRRVFIVGGPSRRSVEAVLSICESCGGNPETGQEAGEDVAGPLGSGSTAGERGYRNDLDSQGAYISGAVSAKWSKGTGGPAGDEAYNLVEADTAVRRLTPLECERLMGWPDDWTRWDSEGNEIADSHRYRMAGNGVVATVAEWLGQRIVSVDD